MTVNDTTAAPRAQTISRAHAAWLDAESARWVEVGHLDSGRRASILEMYSTESSEHRSMLALTLLGTLMFGIGVLLLIGYNWAGLRPNVKVVILVSSVAAAYAASALASTKGHRTVADAAAFAGVLLFGNAIFLIGQTLHMQGDLPDAFMWWSIGALATAALVPSRSLGITASVLVLLWVFAALIDANPPLLMFAPVWAAAVGLAYRIGSPGMVPIAAVAAAFWVIALTHRQQELAVGATALTACAAYAIGSWHTGPSTLARAWQRAAMAILLATFVPLLIPDFHDDARAWRATMAGGIAGVVLVIAALSPLARRRTAADIAFGATALVVAAWLGLLAAGVGGAPSAARLATIFFSVLALGIAVALIRTALQTDSTASLVAGVGFAIAFLIIRWLSLIDSMLWSGLMLLAASAGFFVVARLWRGRHQLQPSTVGGRS